MINAPGKIIPYGRQNITEEDINSVVEVLRSDFLTQGPMVKEFEYAFAAYIGSKYAVAVANGTAALHLCALALNIKEVDKVITTPITFAASANCVKYCGGTIVFADIDPSTYLIDFEKVKALLDGSPTGTYKGIIPVDFAGRAVDLEKFRVLADQYNLWIIEDACHAPGGYFLDSSNQKQNCGNSQFADLAIFSFHPVKHIATGEGGMITTNNEGLYQKLLTLRTHGITRNSDDFENSLEMAIGFSPENPRKANAWPGWYMEMQTLGYNYRLTDFQAALGVSQLKKAEIGLLRRQEIAKTYAEAFNGKPWLKSQTGVIDGHAYHLYIIEITDRLGLYNYLRTKNIFPQVHYIPVHLMPYYKQQGFKSGDYPVAETYYSRCLSLPVYPTLTADEQNYVIEMINAYYDE